MFTLTGAESDEELVVLTPAIGPGIPWNLVVAISMWLASELRDAGLPSAFECRIFPKTESSPRLRIETCQEWPAEMVRRYLSHVGKRRYAIALKMTGEGIRSRIEVQLYELEDGGRLRRRGEWRFHGENADVFTFLDKVIDETLTTLGRPGLSSNWQERFGENDPQACFQYLITTMELTISRIDDSYEPNPLIELVMKTLREAPGWKRAIDLVEPLMVVMIQQCDATDLQLQRVLNQARAANGSNEATWRDVITRARAQATPVILPAANDILH